MNVLIANNFTHDDGPMNIRDLSPKQHVSGALLDHSSLDCRVSTIANRTIDTLATCAANKHKAALFLTVTIYVLRIQKKGRGIRSFILCTLQLSHYVPFIDPVG